MNRKAMGAIVAVIAIVAIAGVVVLNNKSNNTKGSNTSSNSGTSSQQDMEGMDMPGTGSQSGSNTSGSGTGSSSSNSNANNAATSKATISNFSFSPATLTIKKGTTVTWTNEDSVGHTVTVDSGTGPGSALLEKGDSYSYTFNTTGTFSYHCKPHTYMKASVTVTD